MNNALDRMNHDYQDRLTYAGVCTVSRSRASRRSDRMFRHTSLMDGDADDFLLHLRQLGWSHVHLQIRATHIPTHAEAVYSIDELLAGRPMPPHLLDTH